MTNAFLDHIVQLQSHDGYLFALSAGGAIFMLASEEGTELEYWYHVSGPFDPVEEGDVNPPEARGEEPIEVRVLALDHLPEGST